jgi:NTE family protein
MMMSTQSTKTVALVLGSGGPRGYAHIGVIEELERRGYRIVGIAGCSMGALVGGFYAAGKLDEYKHWVKDLSYMDVLKLIDFTFLALGAIRGERLFQVLGDMISGINIEDLPIEFTAVATDLIKRKEYWFRKGSLKSAIRASIAIPSVVAPLEYKGRLLVDGAVLNPLPISACMSVHADYIVAVNLGADVPIPKDLEPWFEASAVTEAKETQAWKKWLQRLKRKTNYFLDAGHENQQDEYGALDLSKMGVMVQMLDVMQSSIAQYKIAGNAPDLLIKVPKDCAKMYEFYRATPIIELGRRVAREALDGFENGHSSLYGAL